MRAVLVLQMIWWHIMYSRTELECVEALNRTDEGICRVRKRLFNIFDVGLNGGTKSSVANTPSDIATSVTEQAHELKRTAGPSEVVFKMTIPTS